jgi:hypothetical protein
MTLFSRAEAHPTQANLAGKPRFHFYELAKQDGVYAAAALAEHADCLELHLEVLRFGPDVVRALRADVEDLKAMARRGGKTRIVGLRMEQTGAADPRWPKFTRLFGFTKQQVFQSAELRLD